MGITNKEIVFAPESDSEGSKISPNNYKTPFLISGLKETKRQPENNEENARRRAYQGEGAAASPFPGAVASAANGWLFSIEGSRERAREREGVRV